LIGIMTFVLLKIQIEVRDRLLRQLLELHKEKCDYIRES